ncbi:MAG: PRC-barrel domain-containing protein [Thermoanaerobacteraceae bacterium]|nr:PRC-barrel domain-containing protein [Thermoanaerobacteraceae bacterium]
MRGFKALYKKELRSLKNGNIIGSLKDILFDHEGRLLYIVVNTGNILNGERIYESSNVKSFTKDSIEIKDDVRYETKTKDDALSTANIIGMVVKSEDKVIGIVEDVYFNLRQRSVTGIGISKGFLMDVYNGLQMILFGGIEVKDTFIKCPSQKGLEVYTGGIKNIINREG